MAVTRAQVKPAMQVPLLDLKPQYLSMAAEIHAAIEKVCASQHFILGPAVKELEASIASYSQCRHGIGLSSGTDALLVALMALGIGPGDAVITSPFTFFATAGTIARVGDIGCLSFFPTKNLGAFGDAGMCVTNDAELAERIAVLRVHGGKPKYYHALIGGNLRLDELQAAVLGVKLKRLDEWTAGRQRNAAFYDQAFRRAQLEDAVRTPHASLGVRHIYNQYVIRARDRDALRAHLATAGVGTEVYYPVPLHLQQCFEYLGCKAGDYPQSERAAAEALALPIYPELSEEQLQYVVDTIAGYYRT